VAIGGDYPMFLGQSVVFVGEKVYLCDKITIT
jgi:hypothetical protein